MSQNIPKSFIQIIFFYVFTLQKDLPIPFCKEARLTIVHMHEKVPRTFYFIVSSPAGAAEAIINVNFTTKHQHKRINTNANVNNNLPIFSSSANYSHVNQVCYAIVVMTIWMILRKVH